MKKLLEKILADLAKKIVLKYQPKIIGITGSIGKTSTKEAIVAALQNDFKIRTNIKNYNNEIGLPLSIIGEESAGRSLFGWLKILWRAWRMTKKSVDYPEILILEMGADKPGDIAYLTSIAPCFIGVVTKVAPAHLEQFGSIDNIAREKEIMIKHLPENGFAILNYDDPLVRQMAAKSKAKIIFYGFEEEAQIKAVEMDEAMEKDSRLGINFKVYYNGSAVPFFLKEIIGKHQIYAALAAIGVGLQLGISILRISENLLTYQPPKGRMHLLFGKKNSLLIDDTYNASPEAVVAALNTLSGFKYAGIKRRVAILGDMLELGNYVGDGHYNVGQKVAKNKIDFLIVVGQNRQFLIDGAVNNGFDKKNICEFENSAVAAEQVEKLIFDNDLILIKGSQGCRMERITKALLVDETNAEDLLVRQNGKWLKN